MQYEKFNQRYVFSNNTEEIFNTGSVDHTELYSNAINYTTVTDTVDIGVLFIDILGFKNKVFHAPSEFNKYFMEKNCIKNTPLDVQEHFTFTTIDIIDDIMNVLAHDMKYLSISDSLYIFDVKFDNRLIEFVAAYFIICLNFNYLIRGAFAFSQSLIKYSKESDRVQNFIGKGIIHSYLLESENAIFPRIIIKNEKELQNMIKTSNVSSEFLELSDDGYYQINILAYLNFMSKDNKKINFEILVEKINKIMESVYQTKINNDKSESLLVQCIKIKKTTCSKHCPYIETDFQRLKKHVFDKIDNFKRYTIDLLSNECKRTDNQKILQKFNWLKSKIEGVSKNEKTE